MYFLVCKAIRLNIPFDDLAEHANRDRVYKRDKSTVCINWFERYIFFFCDKSPSSGDAYLPSCMYKHDLYELCIFDLITNDSTNYSLYDSSLPSHSTFQKVWKTQFIFLKHPRNNRLGNFASSCNPSLEGNHTFSLKVDASLAV